MACAEVAGVKLYRHTLCGRELDKRLANFIARPRRVRKSRLDPIGLPADDDDVIVATGAVHNPGSFGSWRAREKRCVLRFEP